jgi:hypothetical protein
MHTVFKMFIDQISWMIILKFLHKYNVIVVYIVSETCKAKYNIH